MDACRMDWNRRIKWGAEGKGLWEGIQRSTIKSKGHLNGYMETYYSRCILNCTPVRWLSKNNCQVAREVETQPDISCHQMKFSLLEIAYI